MPKMTGTFSLVKLDLKAARADLDAQLSRILKEAVAEWLRVVLAIVPVWSGASHYAFKNLADAVGVPVTALPVTRTDKQGRTRRAPDRRQLGLQSSDVRINLTGPIYSIEHDVDLFYYLYNEENDATLDGLRLIRPGPYYSRAKARATFDSYLSARLQSLKFNVEKHLRFKRQRVD